MRSNEVTGRRPSGGAVEQAASVKAKNRARVATRIDDMGRLSLVIASVSNDARHLESRLTKCLSMMEAVCHEEMVYSDIEYIGAE